VGRVVQLIGAGKAIGPWKKPTLSFIYPLLKKTYIYSTSISLGLAPLQNSLKKHLPWKTLPGEENDTNQ
jgi:hypothetical protein